MYVIDMIYLEILCKRKKAGEGEKEEEVEKYTINLHEDIRFSSLLVLTRALCIMLLFGVSENG